MPLPLKILHVEDNPADAELIQRELTLSQLKFQWLCVSQKSDFKHALEHYQPDIVLCDHSLPDFDSVEAFNMVEHAGLKIPFILITATMSEEFAVMMMKQGIADYLLKDRIQRLPAAVINALEKWQIEREKDSYLEKVIRSERKFKSLIENSNDLIALFNHELNLVYASPNYSRITGWTPLEMIKNGMMQVVYAEDQDLVNALLKQSLDKPAEHYPISFRLNHKTGNCLNLDGSVINLLNDVSLKSVILNVRDITRRKQAEANLTAVIENSNAQIYSLDRELRYITFNSLYRKTLQQLYGLEIAEGDNVTRSLIKLEPREAEEWKNHYSEALSGKSVQFIKKYTIGERHTFTNFSINPIYQDDQVTGLSCLAFDITNEKLADEKIRQNEARFRALIENNYDAITLRDENLELLYRSPSANRILGIDHDESNIPLYETIHPDYVDALRQAVQQAKETPGEAIHFMNKTRHKKGHFIWVEGAVRNMLGNESVKGLIFNYHDITERMEAQLQREKITADLIKRNKDLEQFTYIVSHNLRAPVANILGLSNLLDLSAIGEAEKSEVLMSITASARRLDEVISDLNNILQEKEKITEFKQVVYFQKLIDGIQSSIIHIMKENKAVLKTDFNEVEKVLSIKSYLYSIFYNLIINSIKYRQPDISPVIEVKSFKVNGKTGLSFKDNGSGIDLKKQGDKVFGLYKRFHQKIEGKGMGLFMVKTQVETLGGSISIKSEINQGTEFTILF